MRKRKSLRLGFGGGGGGGGVTVPGGGATVADPVPVGGVGLGGLAVFDSVTGAALAGGGFGIS
jgi:hypothetical protein